MTVQPSALYKVCLSTLIAKMDRSYTQKEFFKIFAILFFDLILVPATNHQSHTANQGKTTAQSSTTVPYILSKGKVQLK